MYILSFIYITSANPKELIKEALQLINHTLFFLRPATAAETGNRRHQLINVSAHSFDLAITERIGQIFARFRLLQLFLLDDLCKLFLPLFGHISVPLCPHR